MKRALALAIVFCMSINSFAAIVADNDGSAFITKAEFDSLKNSFQSQIDNYNSSIDSKIDGAIAAYLAGISTAQTSTQDIIDKRDKVAWCIKGLTPYLKYQYPNFNLGMSFDEQVQGGASYQWTTVSLHGAVKYTKNVAANVLSVYAGTEGTSVSGNVVLKGITYNYDDSIAMNYVVTGAGTGYFDSLLNANSTFCFNKYNRTNTGKLNLSSKITSLEIYYMNGARNTGLGNRSWTTLDTVVNVLSAAELTDANGNAYNKSQIISYNDETEYPLFDVSWTKTLNYSPDTTKTLSSWNANMTKNGTWTGWELWWPPNSPGSNTQKGGTIDKWSEGTWAGVAPGTNTTDTTTRCTNVGLLPSKKKPSALYQWMNGKQLKKGDKTIDVSSPTLNGGLCAFIVNDGETVEWEPSFTHTEKAGSNSNYELNVALSYTPFDSAHGGTIIKKDNNNDYWTTTNRKCKIKFKCEKTTPQVVWVKWWPKDSSIASGNWAAGLDLESCGTYKLTVEK